METSEQLRVGGGDWTACVAIVVMEDISRGRGFQCVIMEEYNGLNTGLAESEDVDMSEKETLVKDLVLEFSSLYSDLKC